MSLRVGATKKLSNRATELFNKISDRQLGANRCPQPVGMIGPSDGGPRENLAAYEIASVLGSAGVPIVCGGRGGVMAAASQGAAEAGGVVVGVLPDGDLATANTHLTVALPTGMGEMRNAVIAHSSYCLVAIGGGLGTISEMALGLKWGKRVFTLFEEVSLPGAEKAESVEQIIEWVLECLDSGQSAS